MSRRRPEPVTPAEQESISVDRIIADAERRAGIDRAVPAQAFDDGPIVANGATIRLLRDLLAVEVKTGFRLVGRLFITDRMKDTRNQTFAWGEVVAVGPKAAPAAVGDTALVSEYFGQEVKLVQGDVVRTLRVGRIRDIVGVVRGDDLLPPTDRVLMERIAGPAKVGRLWMPEDVRQVRFEARVVAVGPKALVKEGDRVLVEKDTTVRVEIDGRTFYLIGEPALLAVL